MSRESTAPYHRLADEQAVALSCTELELLLGPQDADVPLLPSSLLHVRAALSLTGGGG